MVVFRVSSNLHYNCRGMERTYEAPSNEAPHMILGYHQGRLVTYLQHHFNFSLMATGQAKNRHVVFSVASGPSSELQCQQVSTHCTVFAI